MSVHVEKAAIAPSVEAFAVDAKRFGLEPVRTADPSFLSRDNKL
jgi:hypothetical protein